MDEWNLSFINDQSIDQCSRKLRPSLSVSLAQESNRDSNAGLYWKKKKKEGICAQINKCKSNVLLNKELRLMDESLKNFRTKEQQLELDKQKFFIIKMSLIVVLTGNLIFQVIDTLADNYRENTVLIYYWILWIVVAVATAY